MNNLPVCQTLLLELHNGVLHVTLNRPECRNAMSLQMVAELRAVLATVRDKPGVRALVIGGVGGHFCAGGDIKDMANARAQGPTAHRDLNRVFGAANMIKGLEYCVDSTIVYCKERKTFGNALIDNQVIHFRLAELQTEIECLRALVYQATEQYVKGQDVTRLASMAKLKAGRLGREVSDSCLQYWGGMGFMNETPVSRAYRDSRLTSIGGGADEVMLMVLCKMMGTLPGMKKK